MPIPKVVVAGEQWFKAIREIAGALAYRNGPHPGFMGNAKTLAQFMLTARAHFGDYDAAMLATIVEEEPSETTMIYYFPGLELY